MRSGYSPQTDLTGLAKSVSIDTSLHLFIFSFLATKGLPHVGRRRSDVGVMGADRRHYRGILDRSYLTFSFVPLR